VLEPVLLGVLLPALAAGVLLLLLHRIWGSGETPAGPALLCAFSAGHAALFGWPSLPPPETLGWLPWLAILALLPGLAAFRGWSGNAAGWLVRAAVVGALLAASLRPMLANYWSGGEAALWLVLLGAGLLAWWGAAETLAARNPGWIVPLLLLTAACATAGVLLNSGSAKLAQLAGVLASGLGAAMVFGIRHRGFSLAGSGLAVAAVILAVLWLNGYFLGEMAPLPALLLPASLPLAWVGELPLFQKRPVAGSLAKLAAVTVPAAVAFFLSVPGPELY